MPRRLKRRFPEMIRDGHLWILQTPLFRVRNKKETIYCYDDDERKKALAKLLFACGPMPTLALSHALCRSPA